MKTVTAVPEGTSDTVPASRLAAWQRAAVATSVLALTLVVTSSPAVGSSRQEPRLLYVASQDGPAITVIDMQEHEVVEIIDLVELGFTPNAKPHHTAVEADGSHWYVSLISDGFVLKFDRDNRLVGRAPFETPGMLAVDPLEDVLYVGRSMAAVNPPQRIGVIERGSMDIEEIGVFFPRPHAIVAAPGGGRAYTASLAENRIAAVVPSEEEVELRSVPGVHHTFVQFDVSPDGTKLVTGGEMSGQVLVFDLADPEAPEMKTVVDIGGAPWHPVFSPDGSRLYFPQQTADTVTVLDTETWKPLATISGPGLAEPHGSAISPDGRWLFVSGRNTRGGYEAPVGVLAPRGSWDAARPPGTVVVIDTRSHEIVEVLLVPPYAAGMSRAGS